jgi:NosR/NirI family transcriptional regulator, nitrous oxide reductase regulator
MTERMKASFEHPAKHRTRNRPRLDPNHQSSVRGLFIVGDLADAPLIKVAFKQGHTVATHVASTLGPKNPEIEHPVVIIGGGPAGIGAATALRDLGIEYLLFERDKPLSTIQNFPLGKLIFMEPDGVKNPTNLQFQEGAKEALVDAWEQSLTEEGLKIIHPVEVLSATRNRYGFEIQTTDASGTVQTVSSQTIILAVGKRGQHNTLGIPGDDLDHVHTALRDPAAHAGQDIVVVGGGDSAVETAVSLADAGARVVLCCRGDALHRCKQRNQDHAHARHEAGILDLRFRSTLTEITPTDVTIRDATGLQTNLKADHIFSMIGTQIPLAFLERLGIRMHGDLNWKDGLWIGSFMSLVYGFYCLKSKQQLYPFGEADPLGFLHTALTADLGFRTVDASFWGTTIYAMVVLLFGLKAMARYKSQAQRTRYISLISFQWIFLFGIPELLAPLIIDRPWKVYAVSVPWPLSTWSLVDGPEWAGGDTTTAALWIAAGAFSSFVLIPLYVRKQGERFCSYLCGCGGLAETLGDFWRHLAPRGRNAKNAEVFGRIIFLLAIPVTVLTLNDAWGFFAQDALYSTQAFASHWYGLMVDFWLASVIGVALYPYLGNRVWCRFFCPLRAYMEVLSRRFSRVSIQSSDRCIGCGECTDYCQMGIPVQTFAQKQVPLSNINSSCIQCGICIEVCPMDVLSIGENRSAIAVDLSPLSIPRASWDV